MSKSRILVAVATVATGGALLVPAVASAHANSVACVDQSTSTWRITNDHPLSETFTSTEGPSGSVAGGNGSYSDVVWNGDSLHVTGTWSDGYISETTGVGDCTPEVQPTTTTTLEPTTTTTLVTTTTAQETTTSLPQTTTTTSVPPSSTTSPTTTTPATTVTTTPSSSTTSVPSTTLPPPSSAPTTPPPTSTPFAPPTSTPTPCITATSTAPTSSQPGTPSSPPCGRLPATGNPDLGILTGIAAATIIAGAFMLTKTRR